MRFIIFISLFIALFAIQTYFIKKGLINKLDFNDKTKKYLTLFLYLNLFGAICYPLARYYPGVPNWLYLLFSLPIGIIFVTFTITILYSFLNLGIKKTSFKENRRAFFKKTLDVGAITVVAGANVQGVKNATTIEIEEVDVKIDDLKKPYKIAQLSDVHIGGLIDKSFIKNMVDNVNALKVDCVVITGDLVDTKLEFATKALSELAHLKSTYGTYFIVGNHEYFHGVESIINHVNSLGIKTLENENVYIGEPNVGFNLAGVYDRFGFRYGDFEPDLKQALENKKPSPTVLLAHQPKYLEEMTSTKDVDLILSGHTHGGQIFPFNFLVKLQQPYVKGLHQHDESTQIYINKGTGFWGPPMRLGTSSEVTLLRLA